MDVYMLRTRIVVVAGTEVAVPDTALTDTTYVKVVAMSPLALRVFASNPLREIWVLSCDVERLTRFALVPRSRTCTRYLVPAVERVGLRHWMVRFELLGPPDTVSLRGLLGPIDDVDDHCA